MRWHALGVMREHFHRPKVRAKGWHVWLMEGTRAWAWDCDGRWNRVVKCGVGAWVSLGLQAAPCVVLSLTALGVDRGGELFGLHFVRGRHLLDGHRCDPLGHANAAGRWHEQRT